MLTRRWSAFLIAVGVWSWLIWPRFGVAIWKDDRSFADGSPTSFLWVHALLIAASLVIGTTVGLLGVRGWRAARGAISTSDDSVAAAGGRRKIDGS
ncbi:SCO4848 family membrane protein [Actinoplanes sp. NPDC049681]|uniref:SCO4848 family membrane protein n=1 Tax=Actinoplanes sp. NPDC049681 TaxID=3363905 RepID=UPI0037B29CD9